MRSEAEQVEETDPPSTTIALAIEAPKLASISVGKSLAAEQKEKEEAEAAAKAAEEAKKKAKIEAERIKHIAAEKKLQESKREQKQPNYVRIIGNSYEQCVIYVRRITGNAKVKGYAGNLVPEGKEPRVGAAALEPGHVSVVVGIDGDYVTLHDANYSKGHITERKVLASTLKGYIY